jgi:hypothetical protein
MSNFRSTTRSRLLCYLLSNATNDEGHPFLQAFRRAIVVAKSIFVIVGRLYCQLCVCQMQIPGRGPRALHSPAQQFVLLSARTRLARATTRPRAMRAAHDYLGARFIAELLKSRQKKLGPDAHNRPDVG